MKISMKLVYQYMVILFNFSLTSNHFHSLQLENCDSNSRLVVDEDDYGKLKLEMVKSMYVRHSYISPGNKNSKGYTRPMITIKQNIWFQ